MSVTNEMARDLTMQKAAGVSVATTGGALATANEWLTLIATIIAIIAGSIAIYRFIVDTNKRRKDEDERS